MSKSALALIAVMLAGAWFRFSALDATRLNYDRAYPVYQALTIAQGHLAWRSLNTSLGFPNPPGLSYVFAPFMLLPGDLAPLAALACASALSLAGVALAYDLVRRMLGAPAGLVAAAALAINPWAQYYGRGTWVQGPLITGAIAVAWLLWPVLVPGEDARGPQHPALRTFLAVVVLGLVMQTYLLAYVLAGQVALALLAFRQRVPARALLAGALVALAVSAPYFAGVWNDRDQVLAEMRGVSTGEPRLKTRAVEHAFRLVSGLDYEITWTAGAPDFDARRAWSLAAAYALTAAMLAGAALTGRALLRRNQPEHDAALLTTLWLIVPLLPFLYTGRAVHPFYPSSTYPAGLLLLTAGVKPLLARTHGRVVVAGALAACGIIFALDVDAHYAWDIRNPVTPRLDELPYRDARMIGAPLRQRLTGAPSGDADTAPHLFSQAEGVWLKLISGIDTPSDARFDPSGWWVLDAQQPSLYVLTAEEYARAEPLQRLGDATAQRDASGAVIAELVDVPAQPGNDGTPSNIGWQALRVSVTRNGETLHVESVWRVDALPPGRESWYFGPFYHVLDRDSNEIVTAGAHGAAGYTWRAGDVYIDVTDIPVPPGAVALRYGLYDPNRDVRAVFATTGGPRDTLEASVPAR
jgi:4-amino-4-deoxy-L-arabinose transferase-like glycosyltransferase